MKIFKVIFKSLAIIGFWGSIVFSAQATTCPAVTDIISAFAKNTLPPKGWLLVSYTGNQIDRGFSFSKAVWNSNAGHIEIEGNVTCEYTSHNNANPGFLILETTRTLAAPKGKNWRHLKTSTKTTVCEQTHSVEDCAF